MCSIQYSSTIKNFKVFIETYNKPYLKTKLSKPDKNGNQRMLDDKSQMLRSEHLQMMIAIMECYGAQINAYQNSITWKMKFIPAFETNRDVLAKQVCNPSLKTISNRLGRLKQAGFITGGQFRGSCHKFKLTLDLDLFEFVDNNIPCLISADSEIAPIKLENKEFENSENHISKILQKMVNNEDVNKLSITQNSAPSLNECHTELLRLQNEREKKLQHREESKLLKEKYIIKGVDNVNTDFDSVKTTSFKGNTTCQEALKFKKKASKGGNGMQSSISSLLTSDYSDYFKENAGCAAEGSELMSLMLATIFEKLTFHAPSILESISNFIISEFEGLQGDQVKNKKEELQFRVVKAWEYVLRTPGNYIPLNPELYFSYDNKNGFIRTKSWHRLAKKNTTEMERVRKMAKTVNFAAAEFKHVFLEASQSKSLSDLKRSEKVIESLSANLKDVIYKSKI